jgi:hypothetical protein
MSAEGRLAPRERLPGSEAGRAGRAPAGERTVELPVTVIVGCLAAVVLWAGSIRRIGVDAIGDTGLALVLPLALDAVVAGTLNLVDSWRPETAFVASAAVASAALALQLWRSPIGVGR